MKMTPDAQRETAMTFFLDAYGKRCTDEGFSTCLEYEPRMLWRYLDDKRNFSGDWEDLITKVRFLCGVGVMIAKTNSCHVSSLTKRSCRGKVTTTASGFGKVNYKAILDEADDGGRASAPRRRGKRPRVMEAINESCS